mgnify:CR=1 FL=1
MAIFNLPSSTATANTAFMQIIPGVANSITRINTLIYTCGTAVHAVTIMRPVATTITDVAAATGQPVIEVTDAVTMKAPNTVTPEPLAGPDYLAWIDSTGKFQYDTVSSITSNAVTMTGNLSASIAAGLCRVAFRGSLTATAARA